VGRGIVAAAAAAEGGKQQAWWERSLQLDELRSVQRCAARISPGFSKKNRFVSADFFEFFFQ
jgi:hypothetical protein